MSSPLRIAASFSLLACAACASGSSGDATDAGRVDATILDTQQPDGPVVIDATVIDATVIDAGIPDALVSIDAAITDASIDAALPIDAAPPIDAALPIDAPLPIDAALPIDAPTCTPTTTQLLGNPNLDLTPVGTLWVQTLCNVMYPPITSDALPAYPPDTAPFHAWLGGLVSCVDGMEQTVTVPAGTTQLVLRGRRLTITNETLPQVYDSAFVELTTTAGTLIENALTVTNLTPNTAWATFSKTFAVPHAGETVKVRVRSTNDFSDETNFFFDTLALDATVTCP